MRRPLRGSKLTGDFREVDMSGAVSGAQLCHERPSEISPGCDAVWYFINGLNDGMEVMLAHLADSLDEWMGI